MNDNDRRRWEKLVRVNQFGIDNAADFPSGIGHIKFGIVNDLVSDAQAASAAQAAGTGELAEVIVTKDSARETLREQMAAIARTARSMDYEFPGIADEFRFKANLADADFLAKGRAFYTASADNEGDFVAFGLPVDFRTSLNTACEDFESALNSSASSKAGKIAATATIIATIREGMIAARILDAVVRNKYANNPGNLAAWAAASHVEKPPKKKTTPTPPTP